MKKGKEILGAYGRDVPHPQAARATNGGQLQARDVRNYSPPKGPTNINDTKGPGLHGHNAGNTCRPTGSDGAKGRPGLGGDNKGNDGTQR